MAMPTTIETKITTTADDFARGDAWLAEVKAQFAAQQGWDAAALTASVFTDEDGGDAGGEPPPPAKTPAPPKKRSAGKSRPSKTSAGR